MVSRVTDLVDGKSVIGDGFSVRGRYRWSASGRSNSCDLASDYHRWVAHRSRAMRR